MTVANKAFEAETWVNDKRHTWSQWRYGHSDLSVDGKLDTNLPNCAIMDNYYVDKPLWRVDLGSQVTVNGAVVLTWQGAGQGMQKQVVFMVVLKTIMKTTINIKYDKIYEHGIA